MSMNSSHSCNFQNQDEAALGASCTPSVMEESGAPHLDGKDRPPGTCVFGSNNRKPKTDIIIDEMMQLNESCSSFHNRDYVEEIKELQFYVDEVKRFTRPGCLPETLDVALSSISSLVETLSAMSTKRHASL